MGNWFAYILYSVKVDRCYVGFTDNLDWRLKRHNSGWGKYTKRGIPWSLVYSEEFFFKNEAIKREKEIKNMKSRKYIENLLEAYGGGRPD